MHSKPREHARSGPSPAEADAAFAAAQVVVQTHARLSEFLRAGQTLPQIDAFIAKCLADLGARSCFLGYAPSRMPPFPSHACLSVNNCVVHGTAGYFRRPLQLGDLLKIDIGVWHRGWIGDAAWTYCFGKPDQLTHRLMSCGKRALAEGVNALQPGARWVEWARVVQRIVEEEQGFHLIQGMGGHGLLDKKGRPALHGPPYIANSVPESLSDWPEGVEPCEPGTLIAVEPMIAVGTGQLLGKGDRERAKFGLQKYDVWPELVADGSLSVHYEHDVLITDSGPRILTQGLEHTPDVIER